MATLKRGNPDDEKITYIKGSFLAIRPDSKDELFWLAISLEDVSAKNKEVYVKWLNASTTDELEYKTGPEAHSSSKIPIESILVKTILKSNPKEPSVYKISKKELQRIKEVAEYDEEEEEEEEDEEEEEEEEKPKKKSGKKVVVESESEEESEEEKPKKKVKKTTTTTTKKSSKKETPKKSTKKSTKKSESEAESEESEEESEDEDKMKVDKKKTKKVTTKKIPKKTKKSESEAESDESEEESEDDSKKKKKPVKKSTATKKKVTSTKKSKKSEDEEESNSEEDESQSEYESEDEKKKKKVTATKKQNKKRKLEDEGDSEEESEDEEGAKFKEITTGKPVKKKAKGKGGDSQKAPKATKKGKAATTKISKKKGTPNPTRPMVAFDPTWESKSNDFEFCCAICLVREATRAILTKNMTLLQAIVNREDCGNLTVKPTPDTRCSPIELAVQENYHEAIKIIMTDLKDEKKARIRLPQFHKAYTGGHSRFTYGHAIREVSAARGGKEGNEAFHRDRESYNSNFDLDGLNNSLAIFICSSRFKISFATIDLLSTYLPELKEQLGEYVHMSLRAGNLELSSHLIKERFDRDGFGYNLLHVQTLSTSGVDLDSYKSVSVTKKPNSGTISPLHHAAINHNGKYLKQLLETLPGEVNRIDHNGYKPIHYAAASSGPANLQLLISRNLDLNDLAGHTGLTALNIACQLGRVQNVKVLLKSFSKDPTALAAFVNFKNKKSQVALHFAAANGDTQIIKMLLDAGAEPNFQEKITRDTPLIKAVMGGHLEAVKVLVEEGKADIEKKDKFKSTPLVKAVLNGELIIASYLIHMNSLVTIADSSSNTLLHYSSAYGWYEITKYLLEQYKLDANKTNDWKSSPLSLSIKKSHLRISKYLMSQNADANVCDENGRSLLLQTLTDVSESSASTIDFLVEKSKASVNHCDKDGDGPFHYLAVHTCQYLQEIIKPKRNNYGYGGYSQNNNDTDPNAETIEKYNAIISKQIALYEKIGKIFLDNGADINKPNKAGATPLMLCFSEKVTNIAMIRYLLSKGASIKGQYKDTGSNILHQQFFKLLNEFKFQFNIIANQILSVNQNDLIELLQQYNIVGVTPVMSILSDSQTYGNTDDKLNIFIEIFSKLLKSKIDIDAVEDNTKYIRPEGSTDDTIDKPKDDDDNNNSDDDNSEDSEDDNSEDEDYDMDEDEDEDVPMTPKKKSTHTTTTSTNTTGDHPEEKKDKTQHRSILHFSTLSKNVRLVKLILDLKPKTLDPVDVKKFTPLHYAINNAQITIALLFIDSGCSPKISDENGNTPLHLACKKMNFPLIKKLILKNSPVNQKNDLGLTPLMLASKNKENLSDGSLEGEDNPISLLLKNGADCKLVDKKNRNALHYAINASTGDANSSFEVEDLLIKYQVPLNALDNLGRTPLHYCFIKMGFDKIQDNSKTDPIQLVSSLCSFKDILIDIPDKFGRSPLHYACQHGSTVSALHLLQRGADINRLDEDKNSPLGICLIGRHPDCAISLIQKQANVKQPLTMFSLKKEKIIISPSTTPSNVSPTLQPQKKASTNGNNNNVTTPTLTPTTTTTVDQYTIIKESIKTVGMFYHVVSNNWQGVAYIMLDSGLDSFNALHDAFKADKYQLALTLLSKIRDPKDLSVLTKPEGRNLFHIIGMYPSSISNWSSRVQQKLLDAKLSPNVQDSEGRTPLHHAVTTDNLQFINFLLLNKLDINLKDKAGFNPLSLSLLKLKGSTETISTVLSTLFFNNPDLEATFPYQETKITPLIYAIQIKNLNLLNELLAKKININTPDIDGLTPIMHAVRINSIEITVLLLKKKPNLKAQDQEKKTVIHHVVNPTDYGSYENTNLLTILATAGAPIDTPDIGQHTPNYYASLQDDGKMSEALVALGAKKVAPTTLPNRETSVISTWNNNINYEEDFEKYMAKQNEENANKPPLKPKVDQKCNSLSQNSEVYIDDSGLIYDVVLTKVDAKHGKYGQNNFYILQLIYNKQLDNYYVFNRYGRIGEREDHFQTTPYPKDQAIVNFNKIFQSKTGNQFNSTLPGSFTKQVGKYTLIPIDRTDRTKKRVLEPFKLENYPASKLPKEIYDVMKQFCDVEAIEQVLSSLRVNNDLMPLGRISKDTIAHALTLLAKLKEQIDLYAQLEKQQSSAASLAEKNKVGEEQLKLSNQFYELIPHSGFATEKMHILSNEKDITEKLSQLKNLDELETVSKILIAAHNNTTLHPFDYCFRALGVSLDNIDSTSPEYKAISNYTKNTGCNGKVVNIYKLQRKGEPERFQNNRSLKNHYLLWHGSSATNYLSILSQGLKIAPPEAPITGYMFGKGVYFADMFKKSINYCGGRSNKFLLLSEVALGNMAELTEATYLEQPMTGTNSTKGVGREGPDFNDSIILNNGVTIPLNKPIQYPHDPKVVLQMNEYIVYDTSQIRMRYLVQVTN